MVMKTVLVGNNQHWECGCEKCNKWKRKFEELYDLVVRVDAILDNSPNLRNPLLQRDVKEALK